MKGKFRISFQRRKVLAGYLFTLPFLIGFTLFFFHSFLQALIFSFNLLELTKSGYELTFVGWDNYHYALTVHATYPRVLMESIVQILTNVPLILAFSFFTALVLNHKFFGRTVARLIFFLPVILAAGIVLRLEQTDMITELAQGAYKGGFVFSGAALQDLLLQTRLPEVFLQYILDAVEQIPIIVRASGIQILIFLAGLQSIPATIYEAADVEGATAWENFWLITLPMLSPLILTALVYTIIDSFTSANNELVVLIRSTAFMGDGFGVSTAMAVMYFVVIILILAITIKIISRWVFYQE